MSRRSHDHHTERDNEERDNEVRDTEERDNEERYSNSEDNDSEDNDTDDNRTEQDRSDRGNSGGRGHGRGGRHRDRDAITGLDHENDSGQDSGRNGYSHADNSDRYRFTLSNGEVTNLQEFERGRWRNERIEDGEVWSFDGTNLIKTETDDSGSSGVSSNLISFSDPDGDGVFTRLLGSSGALGTSNNSGL